jgi:hypothetical protein
MIGSTLVARTAGRQAANATAARINGTVTNVTGSIKCRSTEFRCGISRLNHRKFAGAGEKERGARKPHKRLLYYINVNRTSLDHLLLGKNADVDKSVE